MIIERRISTTKAIAILLKIAGTTFLLLYANGTKKGRIKSIN
jgi:hypothetical protein